MPELHDLQGLIPAALGEYLSDLAAAVPADHAIVECGSFKGKSTAYLAAGAKRGNGAHVFAVDPWDTPGNVTGRFGFAEPSTRAAFEQQLRSVRLWSKVTPIQAFAQDAARAWDGPPVGLLYIDSDHEYLSVREDFAAWHPHLAPGAAVAFDDYGTARNPGVARAVDEYVAARVLREFTIVCERLAVGTVE